MKLQIVSSNFFGRPRQGTVRMNPPPTFLKTLPPPSHTHSFAHLYEKFNYCLLHNSVFKSDSRLSTKYFDFTKKNKKFSICKIFCNFYLSVGLLDKNLRL